MTVERSADTGPLCPKHHVVMVLSTRPPGEAKVVTPATIHTGYCECPVEECTQNYSPELGYFSFEKNRDEWLTANYSSLRIIINPTQVICSDKRKNSMFLEAFDSDANVQHYRCPQLNCSKGITIHANGPPAYWLGDGFFVSHGESEPSPMSDALQTFLNRRVLIVVGDITAQHVDAIVNAANSTLLGGGGVDGAIHRCGGPRILEDCRKLRASQFPRGLPTGQAAITTAGTLPAKHVIHTVGPIVRGSNQPDADSLASCYRNALALAAQHALRTIAFPAISTGAYGYPRELAAPVVSTVIESFFRDPTSIQEVRLVFYDPSDAQIFLQQHQFSGV